MGDSGRDRYGLREICGLFDLGSVESKDRSTNRVSTCSLDLPVLPPPVSDSWVFIAIRIT